MKKLGLAVLALVGAFLAAELGFRAFADQDALIYQDSEDPALGFELRPGAKGRKSGAQVGINAEGFRGPELTKPKPKGEFRVVVVGDHPTFGLGVEEQDAYVRRLEGLVKPPPGEKVVIVNVSNYQYSLDQKLALLKSRALPLEPDAVVFQVTTQTGYPMPPAKLANPKLKNFLRSHSAFIRWVVERLYWRRATPSVEGPPSDEVEVIARTVKALKGIGAPAMVVYVPQLTWGDAHADVSSAAARYRKASKDNGLPFVDVSPALKGDPDRFLLAPSRPWLNREGHAAAAKTVAPELQKLIKRKKPRPSA